MDKETELRPFPQYTERGIPLLRRVWEGIKADQTAWNQAAWYVIPADLLPTSTRTYIADNRVIPWDCGTAACLAGHAVFATGAKLPAPVARRVADGRHTVHGDTVVLPDGAYVAVERHAARLYGLSGDQAERVFCWRNEADHIERMIAVLEEEPGAELACGCGSDGHDPGEFEE